MARTRAQAAPPRQSPPWLITYSDLMTLLLAFFVLLVSISAADLKKQQAAMESVADTFGVEAGEPGTTTGDRLVPDLPPDADHPALRDLGPLRMKADDKAGKGMVFSQNGLVQVVSLSGDVLFKPGSTRLSPEGEAMLEKVAPILRDIPVPLLLAGHSANLRDEEGLAYFVRDPGTFSPTWELALRRVQTVRRELVRLGVPQARLVAEAYGDQKPRFGMHTPEGRKGNRRVDIILDKRSKAWQDRLAALRENGGIDTYNYRGIQFDFSLPGARGTAVPSGGAGAGGTQAPFGGAGGADVRQESGSGAGGASGLPAGNANGGSAGAGGGGDAAGSAGTGLGGVSGGNVGGGAGGSSGRGGVSGIIQPGGPPPVQGGR